VPGRASASAVPCRAARLAIYSSVARTVQERARRQTKTYTGGTTPEALELGKCFSAAGV
jgi:hypothetical protein